jgi:hypothetical protein
VPTSCLTTGIINAVRHRPLFNRHQVHFSLSLNASSRCYYDDFIKHVMDAFSLTSSVSSVCNNLLRVLYCSIYPTRCNVTQFILSGNCSTCFSWYHHPSSGAQTTVSTESGIFTPLLLSAAIVEELELV